MASWRLGVKSRAAAGLILLIILVSCERPAATVIIGGDVMLDRGVRRAFAGDLSYPFTGIAPILTGADLALANLECPLTRRSAATPKHFSFRCDPEAAEVLRTVGFTAMTLANNHSVDYGRTGFTDTVSWLESAGVVAVGAGPDQDEAAAARYTDINGVWIALLGFVDLSLEGIMSSVSDRPGPAFSDPDRVAAAIAEARRNADFVIVTVHWGVEYEHRPNARQRRLARLMVRAGADLVVGHHPHVLQSVEFMDHVPVCFSAGNLVFDQREPDRSESILVRVRVRRGQTPELSVMPLRISDGRPAPAPADDGNGIIARLEGFSPGTRFVSDPTGWWTVRPEGGAAPAFDPK